MIKTLKMCKNIQLATTDTERDQRIITFKKVGFWKITQTMKIKAVIL